MNSNVSNLILTADDSAVKEVKIALLIAAPAAYHSNIFNSTSSKFVE